MSEKVEVPKIGEVWYVLRPGAYTCVKAEVTDLTEKTVELVEPESHYRHPERFPLDVGLRFVERVG